MDLFKNLPLTHLAFPVYILAMLLEMGIGKKYNRAKYEVRDTAASLATSFVAGGERVLTGAVYALILFTFYEFRIFDFQFSWPLVALCFVLDDFTYYWRHRIEHRFRWAWASHVPHHSSQHFNFSTALRQTWTFLFSGLIVLYIPLAILGFHPAVMGFCAALNLVYQFFVHTETVKKLPSWVEAVMNTPSHHRVHHATNPRYLDANYAGVFIVWDKLFGTFVPEDESDPCRYGIIKNLNSFNPLTVEFHEWIGMYQDFTRPGISFWERLKYMVMPPGWSHDGSRQTTTMIKRQYVRLNPETRGKRGLPGG